MNTHENHSASTKAVFCTVIVEQCQDSVSMTSFKAFARVIWKEGVLIFFHNQHSDVPGTGTTQGDFHYVNIMTFSSTPV